MAALVGVGKNLVTKSRQQIPRIVGVVTCIHSRDYSNVVRSQASNLAAYKRGRGGRSSFSGIVATVLGNTGFMGRYVVNRLGKLGSQVICPYRGDPYYSRHLKLAGDLGQVLFLPFNLRDEASLRKSMQYSNVVINLIGQDYETKNFTYSDAHVAGAARIARIARESGVEKLIHFSALNAQPNPPSIYMKGGSRWLQTKHHGEEMVRNEFPEAVIFRPADIYGPEDRYFNYYAGMWRRSMGTVPLWKSGTNTIKMPVFCFDVAEGVVRAVQDPLSAGKVYECVGPHSYYLSDLIDYMYDCMRWTNFKRSPLLPTFRMKAWLLEQLPSNPKLNLERLEREHITDKVTGELTLEDLGVALMSIEKRAPFELKYRRTFRHYEESVGEFADPIPPPVVS